MTGGTSGYAALLAHAGWVLYGMELGLVTLKINTVLAPTHTPIKKPQNPTRKRRTQFYYDILLAFRYMTSSLRYEHKFLFKVLNYCRYTQRVAPQYAHLAPVALRRWGTRKSDSPFRNTRPEMLSGAWSGLLGPLRPNNARGSDRGVDMLENQSRPSSQNSIGPGPMDYKPQVAPKRMKTKLAQKSTN